MYLLKILLKINKINNYIIIFYNINNIESIFFLLID